MKKYCEQSCEPIEIKGKYCYNIGTKDTWR